MKGWPPKDNKRGSKGHSVGDKSSDGYKPTASRSGTESAPDRGTPASDEFRFPMRPLMPTKDSNDG